MTYKDFERSEIEKLMIDTNMWIIFDSIMQTTEVIDFHNYFDFSYNKNIVFSSDYGGENNESKYNVYTFTFFTASSLTEWIEEINKLRTEKGYEKPAEYKKINPNSRKGKLEDWLKITQEKFKGIIVSFAIDKKIKTPIYLNVPNNVPSTKDQSKRLVFFIIYSSFSSFPFIRIN